VFDAAHSSGAQRGPIHYESVELNPAVAIQKAAASGIEGLIIFHFDYRFFDRVEGRAVALENCPSSFKGFAYALAMGFEQIIGNSPGATMDD
jgi:hypothetical protein